MVQLIESRIEEINSRLARFEQIKKITIMDHEFSEDTGELTPTLKVKRRIIDSMYKSIIDAMYPDEGNL